MHWPGWRLISFYAIKFSMGQHFFKSCQYEYVIQKIMILKAAEKMILSWEIIVLKLGSQWKRTTKMALFLDMLKVGNRASIFQVILSLLRLKYDAILPPRTAFKICIHRYLPRRSHWFSELYLEPQIFPASISATWRRLGHKKWRVDQKNWRVAKKYEGRAKNQTFAKDLFVVDPFTGPKLFRPKT